MLCLVKYSKEWSVRHYGYINDIMAMFVFTMQPVVRKIEKNPTGGNDRPAKDVTIKTAGTLPVDKPFSVENEASPNDI